MAIASAVRGVYMPSRESERRAAFKQRKIDDAKIHQRFGLSQTYIRE